jgi:hypothetical protein
MVDRFAVALKHHLRGELGIYYEDLYDLVRPLHDVRPFFIRSFLHTLVFSCPHVSISLSSEFIHVSISSVYMLTPPPVHRPRQPTTYRRFCCALAFYCPDSVCAPRRCSVHGNLNTYIRDFLGRLS